MTRASDDSPSDSVGSSEVDVRDSKPTALLRDLLGPWWRGLLVLGLASFLGGLAEAGVLVLVVRAAFATVEGSSEATVLAGYTMPIAALLATAFALVCGRVVLGIVAARASARVATGVVARTRLRLTTGHLEADWAATRADTSGKLQELVTSFSEESSRFTYVLGSLISAATALVALLVVAFLVAPLASLIALGVAALLALLMHPLRAAVKRRAIESASAELAFASGVAELTRLDLEIRAFGVERSAEHRLDALVDDAEQSSRRLHFLRDLAKPVANGLLYATMIGALLVVQSIELSDLSSVGAVLLILLRSFSYVQQLQSSSVYASGHLVFVERLTEETARYGAARRPTGNDPLQQLPSISLESVSFEYTDGAPILKDITATLGPREIIGMVGPSGAGKSTLVHLLLGLSSPTSGRVLVGDRDIAQIHHDDWSRHVGFVPQRPMLFEGTVRENIQFFREGLRDQEVERGARLAHIHDEIVALDGGYDHRIGPRGSGLSFGQEQRITIARVLAGEPSLLILDEPTSALDVYNDHLVHRTLEELRGAMTIVIVAHRLSTLEHCDRIMVVQDGGIRALGPPSSLRQDGGFYQEVLELSGLV